MSKWKIKRWLREYFGCNHRGDFGYTVFDHSLQKQPSGSDDYKCLGYVYREKKRSLLGGYTLVRVWEEIGKQKDLTYLDGRELIPKLEAISKDLNTPGIKLWVEGENWEHTKDPDHTYTLVKIFYYQYSEWEEKVKKIDVAQKIFPWDSYGDENRTDEWWRVSHEVSEFVDKVQRLFPYKPELSYIFGTYK